MKFGIGQILFVIVMLALMGSSYMFVFKPAADKRVQRQTEMTARRKALADLRQSTAGIKDLERKIAELGEAIKFFESKLPQEKEIDKILKEIWQLAEANNLQTRTIKTQKSERFAGYNEQPIEISLAGDFKPGFYQFLLQVERLARITRIGQMKLEKITTKDGQMQAKLTLSIFFESESGKGAVAAAN